MDGMKSGTGDDLWAEDDEDADGDQTPTDDQPPQEVSADAADGDAVDGTDDTSTSTDIDEGGQERPYIVRRALSNEGTQFERPNRLTFFVHDDLARGETDLEQTAEAHFDTTIPTFDVREAAYRAAINNPEIVLDELSAMGYEADD